MSCSPEVNALKAQNLIKNESDQAVGKLIHMESEQKLETPESEQNLFSSETEEQLVQATAAAVSKSVKLRAFIDELDARTIVELTLSMKVHASSVSENQAKDVLREILVFAMAESIKLMNRSQALETLFAVLGHEKESLIICLMDGDEQLVDAAPGTYLRTRYIRARAKSLKVRETSNISSETNEQVVKDKVEGPCEDDVIRTVRSREHGSSGFCVPEETPHDTDSCDGSSVTSSETSSDVAVVEVVATNHIIIDTDMTTTIDIITDTVTVTITIPYKLLITTITIDHITIESIGRNVQPRRNQEGFWHPCLAS
eukprot:CAMPEP_0203750048 /NCGR_PEP_ID=MMETSP0098-20131031/4356_1 /ASSEMBLY_ACC=CAM_ASM_000208 /TAXON_ID=96639 /ORGANISM=" , Strain NY0313808BC1" /LENGTH=313 /DNA_ID=CAMNT_0050639185 /DNA_START=440 /DNA_END=1382 /DNA_ORIENTATION=+